MASSSSSSTNPKNSRKKSTLSKNEKEEQPPQKMSKHSSNYNNNFDDYVSSCTIHSIPDDILSDILKMVPMSSWPKLQRINRQFNRSILLCWRAIHEIEFKKSNFHVPLITMKQTNETKVRVALKPLLEMLASYSPRISSIIGFNYFVDYLPKSTLTQISLFKYLESVNFSNCKIRPEYLSVFLTNVATHLTDLNISWCLLFIGSALSLNSIELRKNNDLKLIDAFKLLKLTKFYFDGNDALYGLFLEHLDASSITTISVVFSVLNAELFSNFLTRCHALTSLDISYPRFTYNMGEKETDFHGGLAPSILSSLSSSTHIINNLKTLKMNHIFVPQSVSEIVRQQCERGFTDLFMKLVNLRELSLTRNEYTFKNIIFESTINLHRFRDLRSLQLSVNLYPELSANSSVIVELIKNMKKLEWLLFNGRIDNPDQIIRAFTSSPDLTKSLRYLKLGSLLNFQDANILRDLSMLENLTGLSVDGWNVTNDVLLSWGSAFGGRLEILELLSCTEISDVSFSALIQHLPNLIRLNLEEANISDVGLRALSISCLKLKQLNLKRCENITTAGVQNVTDSCLRLEVLVLECSAVKYESLKVDRDVVLSIWDNDNI